MKFNEDRKWVIFIKFEGDSSEPYNIYLNQNDAKKDLDDLRITAKIEHKKVKYYLRSIIGNIE